MKLPNVNFETRETILQSFDQISDELVKNIVIKVNDVYYRIIDFEFYSYTESKIFQDPHTYKGKLQLQSNRLYLHYSGVDITFIRLRWCSSPTKLSTYFLLVENTNRGKIL